MLQDRFVHVRRAENQLQHFYRCFAQINRKSSDESCDCALLSSNFRCPFTRIIDNRAMNFFSLLISSSFLIESSISHPFWIFLKLALEILSKLNVFDVNRFFFSSDFPFIKEVWCFLTIGKFYLCLLHSFTIYLSI